MFYGDIIIEGPVDEDETADRYENVVGTGTFDGALISLLDAITSEDRPRRVYQGILRVDRVPVAEVYADDGIALTVYAPSLIPAEWRPHADREIERTIGLAPYRVYILPGTPSFVRPVEFASTPPYRPYPTGTSHGTPRSSHRFLIAKPDRGSRTGLADIVDKAETFDAAVKLAVEDYSGDWVIYLGDERNHQEIAYHPDGYDEVFFTNRPYLEMWFRDHEWRVGRRTFRAALAPEIATANIPMSRTSVRGLSYPTAVTTLDYFSDTSYGNDVTDSVVFAVDDVPYAIWIEPARVLDRSAEARDSDEGKRFNVWKLEQSPDESIEEALEDRTYADHVFSTDDPAALVDHLAKMHPGGRRDPLSDAIAALGPYNGWIYSYEYPGIYTYSHPLSTNRVLFTPDYERPGTVQIQVQNDDGTDVEGGPFVPFARMGRTATALFSIVRPWLDKYQPAPLPGDPTAERFYMMEFDKGARVADQGPDKDDLRERVKLLEMNPSHRERIAKLEREAARLRAVAARLEPHATTRAKRDQFFAAERLADEATRRWAAAENVQEFAENPGLQLDETGTAAVDKYKEFHRYEPSQLFELDGLVIPKRVTVGGKGKWVTYRSAKVDPSTLKRPRRPVDYIHEHNAGVIYYLPDGAKDVEVPRAFREATALVELGTCLGFMFVKDGRDVEAKAQRPMPTLCCTPDGKCLIVLQDRSEVLAMAWGGALGVFGRGIDG